MAEFEKPINHSTEAPTPIGSVVVDGESHDVWKSEDVPLPGVRYLTELSARQADLAKLGSDPNAVLDDPAFLCLVARAYAPTLRTKPLESMPGLKLLALVRDIEGKLAPFVNADALAAMKAAANGSSPSTSTSTRSGRTSRTRTGGRRKSSTGSRSTRRSRTSK